MYKIMQDQNYRQIADPIIEHPKFVKLKLEQHHLLCTRYDHCLTVSHYTYHIAKMFKMDVVSATRAALLHDFFFNPHDAKGVYTLVNHPDIALNNANKHFELNDKEKNAIASHMFPLGKTKPRSKESWLVTIIDSSVALYEYSYKLKTVAQVCMLLLIRF